MTKYKIVKESKALIDSWKVGDVISYYGKAAIYVDGYADGKMNFISTKHLNALLELGVVEEVKEWNPRELKVGDKFWYLDTCAGDILRTYWGGLDCDKANQALGNCHPTREAAEAWKDKLLADYK